MTTEYRYWDYVPIIHEKGPYKELMNRYYTYHRKCPECGSTSNTQTLVAYLMDPNNFEDYRDRNGVNCMNCGWSGIVHDLTK